MLQDFIKDTKHKSHQCETEEDLQHITRKFLSTLVPKFVDWKLVYPFIDSDLKSINFRAPNVLENYATFKNFDPEWLDTLVTHPDNKSLINQNETVTHYLDYLNPVPENKELYLFFVHGQKQKNLGEHLNYIYGDNTQEKARIANLINLYNPIFDEEKLAEDIGILLQKIQCGTCEHGKELARQKEKEEEERKKKEEEEENQTGSVVKSVVAKQWNNNVDVYKNPILETFRVDNGLSCRYSTQNLLKQLVISSLVTSPETFLKPIMGKYQNEIKTSKEIDEELLTFIDYIPDEKMQTLINLPSVQSFYRSLKQKPDTDRDLIKTMVKAHIPKYKNSIPLSNKFYNNNEQIDVKIIELLI